MHLLYINENRIKLLSYKKDLFKQLEIDFFSKHHTTKLLQQGNIYNIDILASATKEALGNVFKGQKISKDITFILPSPPFIIKRITLPLDIYEQAIQSFITQKIFTLYPYKDLEFFYTLHKKEDKQLAIAYCLERRNLEALAEIAKILDLNFKGVIPETLTLFKLFEQTLSKTKRENIWYVHSEKGGTIYTKTYFYDSFGPTEAPKIEFEAQNLQEFKEKIKKEKEKLKEIRFNRLILSGDLSLQVRQDTLTKEIGIWVNPLPKIIERLYSEQIKKILNLDPEIFLKYDSHFSILINKKTPTLSLKKSKYSPKIEKKFSFPNIKPLLFPFLFSFASIFFLLWALKTIKLQEIKIPKTFVKKPTSTPTPTFTPTPTPEIKRAELKMKILNGSGVKGLAAKLSSALKDKGYKDIIIGNADTFDYEKTVIKIKNKIYLETILKDLKKYVENPKVEKTSEEKPLEDVTIIIGKDLNLE